MRVNDQIVTALENLADFGRTPPENFTKTEIMQLKTHLKTYLTLPAYGFNSSRYDLAIIFDLIVQVFDSQGFDRSSVNLIKKALTWAI